MSGEELRRLQEVTFFLVAYHRMMDKLVQEFPFHPRGAGNSEFEMTPPPFPGRVRKVTVAMFGIFLPEEVSMPERVEDLSGGYLIRKPLVLEEQREPASQDRRVLDSRSPWTAQMRCVMEILHIRSGRPNLRNGRPFPPSPLRFIEFLLAEFFQAGFMDGVFGEEAPRRLYRYRFVKGQVYYLSKVAH